MPGKTCNRTTVPKRGKTCAAATSAKQGEMRVR